MQTELIAFWWGRFIHPKYSYLVGKPKDKLTEKDLEILNALRTIVKISGKLDIDIGFGKQLTMNDLYKGLKNE